MTRAGVAALLASLATGLVAGCGPKDDTPPPQPPPLPPDAPLVEPGVTELPAYDPTAGHLDSPPEGRERETPTPPSKRNRNARMLGIMLRSTPGGAIAAVDGIPIGPTPTYWEGEFTGGEREFTFALANHAVARYRFIPTTNGVVHGQLEPINNKPGASAPAIPKPAQSTVPLRSGTGSAPSSAPPAAPVTAPDPGDGEHAPSAPVTAPVTAPTGVAPTPTPAVPPTGATPTGATPTGAVTTPGAAGTAPSTPVEPAPSTPAPSAPAPSPAPAAPPAQ